MKEAYPKVGLGRISRLFGISRQAYYGWLSRIVQTSIADELTLQLVLGVRKKHPRIGVRKLYHMLKTDLERLGVKMGRDALFDLLSAHNLLIVKRKRARTTYSSHRFHKYPNLIKGFEPSRANQLWVSDITYIRYKNSFRYLFLVTDAYSKKIVGYCLSDSLDTRYAVKALQDALESNCQPLTGLVHHSDRGVQYCAWQYVELLKEHHIQISMTENGDPRENAVAERVNGILKDEYLNQYKELTALQLDQSVKMYNQYRPHLSCDLNTPEVAHKLRGALKKKWKNYYKNRVNQLEKL